MSTAERPRHEPDGVRHVGDQGRIPEGEQRRERDQRPRTDDNIDKSRSHAGASDGKCGKRAHFIGLYRQRRRPQFEAHPSAHYFG